MATAKVVITIDETLLKELDKLVEKRVCVSRSLAIQEALKDNLVQIKKAGLAAECAKLNSNIECKMSEEDWLEEWPNYL
jgi:metal-responsive CopG/Arc/MetJ family transcriptional regulator